MKLSGTVLLIFPLIAVAHGGGLDAKGGHLDRKSNLYHCHREPCFSLSEHLATEAPQESQISKRYENLVNSGLSCESLLPFGNPNNEDTLLCKRAFAIGHSCEHRSAKWVAYFVDENNPLDLNVNRADDFRPDTELPRKCRKELSDF